MHVANGHKSHSRKKNSQVTILDANSSHIAPMQDTLHRATFVAEALELDTRRVAKIQGTLYLHKTYTMHVAFQYNARCTY